jgi:oligopeptidase B
MPRKTPTAPQKTIVHRAHGDQRVDEYHWLKDRADPAVIAYLEAENAYTEERMRGTRALQRRLVREMRARIKETDLDVPVSIDGYSYYSRTVRGKQYAIHCRRPPRGREQILLDENALARDHDYFALGVYRVSPDHALLAYGVDTKGDERYTVRIRDLRSGAARRDVLRNVSSVAWSPDDRTLFYVVLDALHRPYQLYRHELGQPQKRDVLLYHEKDEAFFASVSISRSRAFIFLDLHAKTTSEVRYLPADRPHGRLRVLRRRERDVEYMVDHGGDYFYVLHNRRAANFKLSRTAVRTPHERHWRTVLPHRRDVLLEGVDVFAGHLVTYERERGNSQIAVHTLPGLRRHRIAFRESVFSVQRSTNPEFAARDLRFTYTSLITPASVYSYDMERRRRTLLKQTPVLGGYDPRRYRSERIWARATDGTRVPISLVYRAGLRRNGRNPTLLSGYGAYGLSREPSFSSLRLSLLDRGFLFAIAHIRGGSEMGRHWYERGKFEQKTNTFTDFIACAETLIRRRYTSPRHLAISGGSAGGLLMGAVINLRPELFAAVLAQVPFVDTLNTMLDPNLPLTVVEYDEWGDPNDPKYYHVIRSYSPYDNVEAQDYPPMLVTAGLNDPRVGYWEPAKWVSRLRNRKTDENELLLKTEMGSGHFGSSGRYNMLREIAFEYAYLLTRLGVEKV